MGVNVPTSSDYEAEANRVRKEIDETVKELRLRLTPSSLASEAAAGVGLTDASWAGAFEFASKRHPIPTAIAGLGIAAWALMAIRNRSRRGGVASLASPLRESSESLVDFCKPSVSGTRCTQAAGTCSSRSSPNRCWRRKTVRRSRKKAGRCCQSGPRRKRGQTADRLRDPDRANGRTRGTVAERPALSLSARQDNWD